MVKNKKQYEPITGNKGGRITKKKRLSCLDTIRQKYEKDGSFNKSELARDLKISRHTMLSLIEELKLDMDSLTVVHVDMKQVFARMESRMLFLWDKLQEQAEQTDILNTRGELSIMKELRELIKEKYKLLQEFGEAPKQAENINLQAVVINADIDIKGVSSSILEEI